MDQVSMEIDIENLEKIILNHAQARSGIIFNHVDIEIKKNVIRSITVFSQFNFEIKD